MDTFIQLRGKMTVMERKFIAPTFNQANNKYEQDTSVQLLLINAFQIKDQFSHIVKRKQNIEHLDNNQCSLYYQLLIRLTTSKDKTNLCSQCITDSIFNHEHTIHKPSTIRRYVSFGNYEVKVCQDLHHFQQNSRFVNTINL